MKTPSPSLTACLVVGVSCLMWTGGITLAMVYFLGLSSTVGWIIGGSLALSSMVAVIFILHEMRNAIELPDTSENTDLEGTFASNHWSSVSGAAPVPRTVAPAFRVSGDVY